MRTVLLAPLLVACGTEYQVSDSLGFGVANPFELETPTQTDRIVQAHVPEVDVLWVVDLPGPRSEVFIEYAIKSSLL